MMAISEAQRFQMHAGLRAKLGAEVADTMMEHLPPMGWADVARRSDVERIDGRIDHLERRIDGVIAGLWALGSLTAAGFTGLFALIATKL
jgi:polyhydroxyalkanoate synthesis regulator phasin